jgi:transcription elongation GreA/GreB family factor
VTKDNLIRAAERGEAAYDSFVEISVEGLFGERVFRLCGAGADPRRGELSISSPVGKALLGLTAGAETEYRAGPVRRRIDLHAVDNRLVLDRLGRAPEPDASPEPF